MNKQHKKILLQLNLSIKTFNFVLNNYAITLFIHYTLSIEKHIKISSRVCNHSEKHTLF